MSSREIAELVGSSHDSVLKTVRRLIAEGVVFGNETPYTHPQNGQQYPEFVLGFRDTMVVASGYSAELRARIIDRWRELESKAAKPVAFNPSALSRMDILTLAMEAEKGRLQAISERDEAIRTKAMIGSKREATAMATASKAKAESQKLKAELGFCAHHATIKAVHHATGQEYDWLPMRRWCKAHGVPPKTVVDNLYGAVKAWPAQAWRECHNVDLWLLFGFDSLALK